MELVCRSCGHEFDGELLQDELGIHSVCPECGASFDVDVLNDPIIIKDGKCQYADGKPVKPDGIHELDPCIYEEIQVVKNVTVRVLKCQNCGHIELEWFMQRDSVECPECESRDCAYNNGHGICKYPMVFDDWPNITDHDGCTDYVIKSRYSVDETRCN